MRSYTPTPGVIPGVSYQVVKPQLIISGIPYGHGEVIPVDEIPSFRLQQLIDCRHVVPVEATATAVRNKPSAAQTLEADSRRMEARPRPGK